MHKKWISALTFFSYINVLFIASISNSQAMPKKYINYKIEPESRYSCINVSGTFNGEPSGEYLLRLPLGRPNINFSAERGDLKYVTTSDPTLLKVQNDPGEPIKFKYTFCNINPYRNIDFPIVEKDFVEFNVLPALITFEDNLKENVLIGIDLAEYSEKLKSVTSYNYNLKKFLITDSIEVFRESVIAIGDFNVDQFKVKGSIVHVVSNGKWSNLKKNPSSYIEGLINTQREFWNDYNFPIYVVFLMKQNLDYPVPKSIMGRHRHNVSIALMPEEKDQDSKILYALSHEAFHAWLGMKMKMELPQGKLQWFMEGFNDFYGLYLLKQSNLVSVKDYMDIYNIFMEDYQLSPIRSATNEIVKNQYQMHNEFGQLAQMRGHFSAKQLRDYLKRSHDENLFDLAIRELFARYQRDKWQNINEARIDEVFIEFIGPEKWKETKQFINGDKEIIFSPTAFSPFAKLADVEMDAPEFGFNVEKLIYDRIIEQVDTKSNAYKAGLREGDKVKYYQLDHKAPKKEVIIAVIDNGTEKIIKFKPKVVKKMVPQYVMVKGDVFEKRLRNRV